MDGSAGYASIALPRQYPNLTFIVKDLPDIVAQGPEHLASQEDSPSLSGRISYKAHSFFKTQSVKDDADISISSGTSCTVGPMTIAPEF